MWARGHTCTSVIVGRSGCGAKILLSHHHAFLFCYLLLVQSDRVVFSPNVGFRFVWRRRSRGRRFHSGSNSGWSLQLYMTLASLPQFIRHLGKLSLKGNSGVLHGDGDFGNMMYTDLGRKWEHNTPTGKIPSTFNTGFRKAVPQEKRMVIVLYWLAHAPSFSTLAGLFGIGKATAVSIVHTGVQALRHHMVPSSIRFRTGNELSQVICDFEALCHLPQCAGALDGMLMRIEKPVHFGDAVSCYYYFRLRRCSGYLFFCKFRKTWISRRFIFIQ